MWLSVDTLFDFNASLEESPTEFPEQHIDQPVISYVKREADLIVFGSFFATKVKVHEVCDLD